MLCAVINIRDIIFIMDKYRKKKKNLYADVLQAERESIAAISFVPSAETRKAIYATAKAAKLNPSLCSKLWTSACKSDRVEPSNSTLVKIATGQPLPWNKNGMSLPEIRNDTFAILNDAFPPLLPSVHRSGTLKGSNGPNGVLVRFLDDQRINLFDTDDDIDPVIAFRKADAKTKNLLDISQHSQESHF